MSTVHILKAKPGKTLEQSYGDIAYANDQGHTECVEFIRQTLNAPATLAWKEGMKVTRTSAILPGTPIGTFVDGKYPQTGSTGKHAAIYLSKNAVGILVLDQWRTQGKVKSRTIPWVPRSLGASNDGSAFSVIEW